MSWSEDGRYLASGANDNLLCVWAATANQRYASGTPHLRLDHVPIFLTVPHVIILLPQQRDWEANGGVRLTSPVDILQTCG